MLTADVLLPETRSRLAALVEREVRATGSRMAAYKNVGELIGATESWVRHFIGRQPDTRPDMVVGLNILSAYRALCGPYHNLCASVERKSERLRAGNDALERRIDAAAASALELVERTAAAKAAAAESKTGEPQCLISARTNDPTDKRR